MVSQRDAADIYDLIDKPSTNTSSRTSRKWDEGVLVVIPFDEPFRSELERLLPILLCKIYGSALENR